MACQPELPIAYKLVNESIAAHGGMNYDTLHLEFAFRDRWYAIKKQGGQFTYERFFVDSSELLIHDILTNNSFRRFINDKLMVLEPEQAMKYENALNSVAYFALLPHGLNDLAVIKEYIGISPINGTPYECIKISFQEEGGGVDFEDEFLYWIHPETHFVDYLAYSYHTEGGGLRFREAFNRREASGIIIQDYRNYKPNDKNIDLTELPLLFERNALELVSEIVLSEKKPRPF